MNVMKKMISAVMLIAVLLLVQNAEAQHRAHHKGEQMLEKMKTELQLTAEQETQVKAIQEKYQVEMEDLKTQDFEDKMERRTAFRTLVKAQKEEISQILTEEQKAIARKKRGERREHHQARKGERKELRQALKTYKETNIHPVILAQRAKLEQDISAEDKATIADLRLVFEQLKTEKVAHKQAFSKDKKGDRPNRQEMMTQRKAKKEAIKEQYQEEFEMLKALNEKYSAQIDALHQEIEPQKEVWKKEMEAIKAEYEIEEKNAIQKRGHQKHSMKHKGMGGKKHFILLDPNERSHSTAINTQASTSLKSYPNPAINSSTLAYTVTNANRIKITLTDESGNVLKVLVNEYKKEGDYQMEVDLSDLKNGAYYYTVTDDGGISSTKVVVSKF